MSTTFAGFKAPGYTQTPNDLFDTLLPEIDTLGELKVTLVIIRATLGWHVHRGPKKLSLSTLERATGLARHSVIDGVAAALKRGTIVRQQSDNSFTYSLNVEQVKRASTSAEPAPVTIPATSVESALISVQGPHQPEPSPLLVKETHTQRPRVGAFSTRRPPLRSKLIGMRKPANGGRPRDEAAPLEPLPESFKLADWARRRVEKLFPSLDLETVTAAWRGKRYSTAALSANWDADFVSYCASVAMNASLRQQRTEWNDD